MAADAAPSQMIRRRIGVVGGGIAGLTAAYVLSATDDVTLFEAERRLGGHAHTHQVTQADGSDIGVDSGFIVHNRATYPLLTRLFTELGVTVQDSEMSMSVTCAGCGLEYAGQRGLGGLAAGLRQGRLRYARMLGEVLRFHRSARRLLASGPESPREPTPREPTPREPTPREPTPGEPTPGEPTPGEPTPGEPTLGEFLAAGGYSPYFTTHFALPFVAAVWSCPPQTALSYPARYLFAFLNHHGLLSVTGSPPWLTVSGGSHSYVERVAKQLASVQTGVPVTAVRRSGGGVLITCAGGDDGQAEQQFDAVVIATHPDQALRLLADPTAAEREVLGTFRYSRNETILHTDDRVLPANPRVRASWNYALPSCAAASRQVEVSYDLNRLQRLPGPRSYIVTLNGDTRIARESVVARMSYEHPVYDQASVAAQRRLPELNDGVTAYAGAYHGWGFHEDGCRSGLAAAHSLGGRW
jgi:predicted NAD/FAD-binding protein